ncbi:Gfo/Idh/MocA family oxidoreductase [Candidatus Thorarchaeota archaeon]|nr:MAG: Gfo/Idh/MocA family oxidoreductase [Candidatus Thorarchaeota archaeon]
MSNKNTLHVGLIGTGNIGKTHLISFSSLQETGLLDIDIAAVCDTDQDSLARAADLFDIKTTYLDYNKLVENPDVDIIYVCTPTNLHSDMVKVAVKNHKAVFCEKPLARSSPQAQVMMAMTRDAGVPAGVGLVLRYDQFLLFAKRLLDEHDFGTPMLAHIRDDQRFPVDYIYYSHWRGNKTIAGGGTLIEHSIHDIDILRWFLGDIESVYARTSHFAGRDVEDHASVIMNHTSGATSTLDSVWHWVERPNERYLEFFFEKGYIGISLESDKRYLEYHLQGDAPVKVWDETANAALLDELGLESKSISPAAIEALTCVGAERYTALNYAFLKAVKEKISPRPDFGDAVAAHNIVDAAYESTDKGRCIALL